MNSLGAPNMESFSEYELLLIHKIATMNRWCPDKHVSRDDLLKGRLKSDKPLYEEALDNLLKKQIFGSKNSQGRSDVCLNKKKRQLIISALCENMEKYKFINEYSIKRIR